MGILVRQAQLLGNLHRDHVDNLKATHSVPKEIAQNAQIAQFAQKAQTA